MRTDVKSLDFQNIKIDKDKMQVSRPGTICNQTVKQTISTGILVRRETRGSSGHGSCIVLSAASVSPIDMVLYGTSTSIPFSYICSSNLYVHGLHDGNDMPVVPCIKSAKKSLVGIDLPKKSETEIL